VKDTDAFYRKRTLSDGYPELRKMAHKAFSDSLNSRQDDKPRIEKLLTYLGRLVDLNSCTNIAVLGCGPYPQPQKVLLEKGYRVVGVEPVESFVESARVYLGEHSSVIKGAAEEIPLPDCSQDLVFFESVLEHVDSIPRSLEEIYRVLSPGGVLYLSTTNRYRFSISGFNGEFNVPYYNWFPRLVKESYIFHHLHYRPTLANYTERPAVHWLSYADLCSQGRDAGFSQFYSILDLLRKTDLSISLSRLRRIVLPILQRNPWLRSLALTQVGHVIFMLKRLL
jgi:SAM-dependent methyltransferase